MNYVRSLLDSRSTSLFIFCWLALVITVSIISRRRKGLPILRPQFDHALFLDTWRSGHSLDNAFLQFGGARSCLWVAVNDGYLHVSPHFPFSLGFLVNIWKLEFSVPVQRIFDVEHGEGRFTGGQIRITFMRKPGITERFQLSLRSPEKFLAAVNAAWKASSS